jgi:hypothetical protein
MSRPASKGPSNLPRMVQIAGGVLIVVCALVAFIAMGQSNFGLAFPMMIAIVVLLIAEVVSMVMLNRDDA